MSNREIKDLLAGAFTAVAAVSFYSFLTNPYGFWVLYESGNTMYGVISPFYVFRGSVLGAVLCLTDVSKTLDRRLNHKDVKSTPEGDNQ